MDKEMIDSLNFIRFFCVTLPTIFAFVIGIGFFILGVFVLFQDVISSLIVIIIGLFFITLGLIFKSDNKRLDEVCDKLKEENKNK